MERSTRNFGPWAKASCDQCADEFQVTRCNSSTIKGQILCSDCVDYNTAYQDGWDAAMKERHDQHTDSADNYNDVLANPVGMIDYQDEPYIPQVGEECEFQSFIGNDWIKGVLLASTESYAILKSDQREHSFNKENVNFRPLKTERDKFIEQALDITLQPYESDKMDWDALKYYLENSFGILYDAGLIK